MIDFNKPYNRTDFLHFLEHDFLPDDFVMLEEKLEDLNFTTNYTIEATHLGVCRSMGLDVYEILHSSSHDARVGIAQDAFRLMLNKSYNNRALIIFHSEGSKQYRFSLLQIEALQSDQSARITRSFSNPRRYSFLLGEGAHVKTPKQFLIDKGKIRERTENAKRLTIIDDLENRFSVEVLTKEFYRELSDWYFWAVKNVSFPNDINDENDNGKYNAENVIRLITRLIFVWFLRQKELVKPDFFDTEKLSGLLKDFDAQSATQHNYYRAILQNLFFATLNQETGKRRFAEDKGYLENRSTNTIKNYYRYEKEFSASTDEVINYFSQIPFLNGGLFECLDAKIKDGKTFYWDGFSRNPKRQARVANELFFAETKVVDLSSEYNDTRMKAVKVSGIIEILKRYNFTVEENTPIDVLVALDPELLGKVFENLLGAYNPETQETARKQTGSFYTPREIVSYMVNESLIAYYQTQVPEVSEMELRNLFSYEDKTYEITNTQREQLIQATFDCKILDPACGSGAFPMGILQQMVHVLRKLDPDNEHWNSVIMAEAMKDFEETERLSDEDREDLLAEIEKTFDDGLNYPDYARKLHLIENCIYGVDIQSIAVQITKLRFFISLVCEQRKSGTESDNYGIRPLPNLETKFVAANTLIGLEKTDEDLQLFNDDRIKNLIDKLQHVRHRQFLVTHAAEKKRLREKDDTLRVEIENEITKLYVKHKDENKSFYQRQKALAEKKLELLDKTIERSSSSTNIFGEIITKTYKPSDKSKKELKEIINSAAKKIEESSDYSRLGVVVALARQITSWNPYDQNASSPFFDPEWMFGIKEGFDVVIGNPPYGAKLTTKDKITYKKIYPESQFKIDTYSLFLLHSTLVLRKLGICTFIIPNTLLDNYFEENVRKKILLNNRLREICDLNDKVFESAVVHAMVISYVNEFVPMDYNVKINISTKLYGKYNLIPKTFFELQDKFIFQIRGHESNDLFDKLKLNSERLEDVLDIRQAIKSGNDSIFISDTKINDDYKPILRGKDVYRYSYKESNKFIYYGNHLACPRRKEIFEQPKILIREAGSVITATYDDSNFYIMSSLYNAISKDKGFNLKYLLVLINSQLFQFLMNQFTFEKTKGAFTKAKIYHYYNLPVKIIQNQNPFIELVDQILLLKKENPQSDTTALEQQIDNLVYRLYDLTYDEVKVVDPAFALSEEEYNNIEIE